MNVKILQNNLFNMFELIQISMTIFNVDRFYEAFFELYIFQINDNSEDNDRNSNVISKQFEQFY